LGKTAIYYPSSASKHQGVKLGSAKSLQWSCIPSGEVETLLLVTAKNSLKI